MQDAARPPEGTIALLFTDIEGSTQLAARLGAAWPEVLAVHHRLVRGAIADENGFVDAIEGDAFFATFADTAAAARAAVSAQRALRDERWPGGIGELKVRMGLHAGYVERVETGYVGLEVHRAARVAAAAHGGQVLLTAVARGLVADAIATEPVGFHRLKDFPGSEQLFCAVIDGRGAAAFPPPRAAEARPTNLPAGLPTLVGRDEDLSRVRDAVLIEGERLVTLTGRGGAGKTSLALVAAASLLDPHPGGVWVARLANAGGPESVLPAIAAAVGARVDLGSEPLGAIVNRLRDRGPSLLVLDNMEHLLGAAPAVAELLHALPELRLLVTSQAPLRLAAERCVPLDALDDEPALALVERVMARRSPGFSVERAGREALLEIVHLLDGLPLALELAAARLMLLTPAQLRDRLRASPDVLRDDRADRPERHRSLRATVEWTLTLLDPPARELFTRLGSFAAPVELEEIEAVAGGDGVDVVAELATLLDVALVRRVESGDGRVRFGLPEALRQIAASLLDAAPDGERWRRAHALRQQEIINAAWPIFVSRPAYDAAVAADAEIAAAIRWSARADPALAASLAASRGLLLADLGRLREALEQLEPLLEEPPDDPVIVGRALTAYCWALTAAARIEEAIPVGDRAVAMTVAPEDRAMSLTMRGLVHSFRGDHEQAIRDSAQATEIARSLAPALACGMLMLEAQARLYGGQLELAAERLAEAERVGGPVDAVFLWRRHTVCGDTAMLTGRPRDALEHYSRSLEEAQARGNEMQILFDLIGVANALAELEEDAEAIEVVGIANKQMAEMGGADASAAHLLGTGGLSAARARLGAADAEEQEALGSAVPAAARVARACELARAMQPA